VIEENRKIAEGRDRKKLWAAAKKKFPILTGILWGLFRQFQKIVQTVIREVGSKTQSEGERK